MDEFKKLVLDTLEQKQGCKAIELIAAVAVAVREDSPHLEPHLEHLNQVLDELIEANEIIEIEYVLPSIPYRIKSFLLPKGTPQSVAMPFALLFSQHIESEHHIPVRRPDETVKQTKARFTREQPDAGGPSCKCPTCSKDRRYALVDAVTETKEDA